MNHLLNKKFSFIIILVLILISCGGDNSNNSDNLIITYLVESDCYDIVYVHYFYPDPDPNISCIWFDGNSLQSTECIINEFKHISTPWQYSFTAKKGDRLYLSSWIQSRDLSTDISESCEIQRQVAEFNKEAFYYLTITIKVNESILEQKQNCYCYNSDKEIYPDCKSDIIDIIL